MLCAGNPRVKKAADVKTILNIPLLGKRRRNMEAGANLSYSSLLVTDPSGELKYQGVAMLCQRR